MSSNETHQPDEHRISMIGIEESEFIIEESEKLEAALNEAIHKGRNSFEGPRPLIQKVPPVLLSMKEDFKKHFHPRLVTLGPLHHGRDVKYEQAEHTKRKHAALFAKENKKTCIGLFNKVKEEIEDLRKCYKQEDIEKFDDDQLAWMLFVDGCAVLYAIHYGLKGEFKKLNTKPDLIVFAQLDLFLLENQLPYRVLQILIDSTIEPNKWKKSIAEFIDENLITNIEEKRKTLAIPKKKNGNEDEQIKNKQEEEEEPEMQDYAHLLERYRSRLLEGDTEKSYSSMTGKLLLSFGDSRTHRKTFRSVKELKESGIRVKPSKKSNSLKNISFYCNFLGSLRMPRLLVDDSTAAKFLNLVALEMCRDYENDFGFTSYLWFLDSLIDTAEDVKELRVAGMLHNYLGSDEEVANLFNKMSRDLVPDQWIYHEVIEDIHKYCNNRWTTTMVQAYYTYFNSPWTFLAFFGALLGLIFSAIQAYYSFPNHKGKKHE